jgi:hypothetical protein
MQEIHRQRLCRLGADILFFCLTSPLPPPPLQTNIVTLHDIIHTKHTLTFVFEYLKMDLKQYMDQAGGYIVRACTSIVDTSQGLARLHCGNI